MSDGADRDAVVAAGPAGEDEVVVARPPAWKQWLRLLLAVFVIAAVVFFASRQVSVQADVVAAVERAELWQPVVAALALLVVMVGNGVILRTLVAHFGVKLDAKSWLGITFVASMLNFVSPISGAGAMRGVYLKRVHGLPYGAFAAVVATSWIFTVTSSAALAVVSLVVVSVAGGGVPGGRSGVVALAVSLGLLCLPLSLLLLPRTTVAPDAKGVRARLLRLAATWRSMGSDKALLARLAAVNVVTVVCHGVAFVVAFHIAGFSGSFWVPLTSSAFARTATMFAITPAGLGIYEAFGAVSAQMVGVDAGAAVVGVLIVRVLSSAVSIAGGLCFSPLLLRFRRLGAGKKE